MGDKFIRELDMSLIERLEKMQDRCSGLEESDVEDLEDAIDEIKSLQQQASDKEKEIEKLSKLCVEGVESLAELNQEISDCYDALRIASKTNEALKQQASINKQTIEKLHELSRCANELHEGWTDEEAKELTEALIEIYLLSGTTSVDTHLIPQESLIEFGPPADDDLKDF